VSYFEERISVTSVERKEILETKRSRARGLFRYYIMRKSVVHTAHQVFLL
jgi:hypothetical protein